MGDFDCLIKLEERDKNMKKVMKNVLLWCLILFIAITFQPVSTNAAVKKSNLKAPIVYNWKKTWDGSWNTPPSNGVEYTVKWKKVAGASGYQIKVFYKEEGRWISYYKCVHTKRCSYSEAGSTIEKTKIRVRAYKVVNGKKQYGPWSKTKISSRWY